MSKIEFLPGPHIYVNKETGHHYTSVTQFIHKFVPPFDEDGLSKRKAAQLGISQEEVLKMWREANKTACKYGTEVHAIMENYIKDKVILPEYQSLYDSFNEILAEDLKWTKELKSEEIIYNDEYEICGTSDLIIDYKNGEFAVGDFKTNKNFEYCSKYESYLNAPVNHLANCQHNIYALQLSLYAYFYSLLTGKVCRKVFLLYKVDDKWTYISCNYMQFEVRAMLLQSKNLLK